MRSASPVPYAFRVRFVPQKHISYIEHVSCAFRTHRPISCTEHVSECGSYPRGPSPVPNTFRSAVRTPEAHLLYRTRFGVRFVPQRPLSCTIHVPESSSYPRGPSPVPNTFRVRFVPHKPFSCTKLRWKWFSYLRKLDIVPGESRQMRYVVIGLRQIQLS